MEDSLNWNEDLVKEFMRTPVKETPTKELKLLFEQAYLQLKKLVAKRWVEAPKEKKDFYRNQLVEIEQAWNMGNGK